MLRLPPETRLLFSDETNSPPGRVSIAGYLQSVRGAARRPSRVLGNYALVYLLDGGGSFRDQTHGVRRVQPGDLLLLFPEIAHAYGPGVREAWSEFFVVFDGPVFDLWRQIGILNPAEPVRHVEPVAHWLGRMEKSLRMPRPATVAERTAEICDFLSVLNEMLTMTASGEPGAVADTWLLEGRGLLEANLNRPISFAEVAREVGMSYETFRKRFTAAMGISPARYRMQRRIEAAQMLLLRPELTNQAIAKSLGFSDEYYFSKRFKQIAGLTPREFRAGRAKGG